MISPKAEYLHLLHLLHMSMKCFISLLPESHSMKMLRDTGGCWYQFALGMYVIERLYKHQHVHHNNSMAIKIPGFTERL